MNTGTIRAAVLAPLEPPVGGFPDWAVRQVDRLLKVRAAATTASERAELDLQIAAVYDTARRYGTSLLEVSEL